MTLSGRVLITGGSGTLGRAIVRTAEAEGWNAEFSIYSRSEYLQAQMRSQFPHARFLLGDVRDYDRLVAAVAGHDLVLHCAAMKRLPECEAQPTECMQTNVVGSANVVRACIAGGVERCVGISTDKACAAISVYGASKRLMEGLFIAGNGHGTIFTLCRYGNVVASRGSVIPLWREQVARGEALTITNADMTRFWMSEEQAVLTVELAAALGPGACVVPKMKSLSIVEMASILHPDAPTRRVGLRSIEKLHEDLVSLDEAAMDWNDCFILDREGTTGHRYSSDMAPRLSAPEFLRMLEIAEANEVPA
jgi:UDP-N-acetylglucosamine 4,6-dehydratase/5-epimerase